MTERQLKIRKLVSLPLYLAQLSVLAGRSVSADELLSIQETTLLRDRLMSIPEDQFIRATFPFEARKSSAFAAMIDQLQSLNGSPVVLWPPKANDCGLLPLPSLRDINFGFSFDLIPEGILVIATNDGIDRIVLEFDEEDDGSRSLEIELHGPHWTQATLTTLDL